MNRLILLLCLLVGQMAQAASPSKPKSKELLSTARARYEKGDYAGAIKAYEAIPQTAKEFVRSREELGWAYLRNGDLGSVRGLLTHLNSDLVPLEERLEGRVLGAITHLKQCQYDGVKAEIQKFQNEILPLAKALETDAKRSKRLKPLVTEAVLKMRYVKLELLSQLQWIEKLRSKSDVLANENKVADLSDDQARKIAQAAESKQIFPVNKDVWADEIFKVRAISSTECESLQRGKQ